MFALIEAFLVSKAAACVKAMCEDFCIAGPLCGVSYRGLQASQQDSCAEAAAPHADH